MAAKDKTSPATTSCAYDDMAPRWQLIETLLGGTRAMREAGEQYAPMHAEETQKGYNARIQGAVLLNMVEKTLNTLSGKPFSDPIKPNDDIPAAIKDKVLWDVDLQGNDLNVFCRQWFREGLAKALAHVLVDMPRPGPTAEGQPRTLADDRREGLRPYWVLVKPENVIFARAEVINGAEVLQEVRILECYTEQDGFAEVSKQRIRRLLPGHVELYEPDPKRKKDGKPVWNRTDEWDTKLDYIPLVTFYAARDDFMHGKPPMEDLADLNVTHWQSTSDQRHILTVSRFPILACSGASGEDSDPVVIGPNKILYNADPQGKFYYVEHTGAAIEAGRNDLKDLEETMAGYGAQFLIDRPGDETATGRAIDSAEASSDLAAMAIMFEDAVAQALDITAEWMNLAQIGGTVEVVKDYFTGGTDQFALAQLQAARTNKDISRKAYLKALISFGVLAEDFDIDEDAEVLDDEAQQATLMGMSFMDLNPGGGPEPTPPGKTPPEPGTGTKPPAKGAAKPPAKGKGTGKQPPAAGA